MGLPHTVKDYLYYTDQPPQADILSQGVMVWATQRQRLAYKCLRVYQKHVRPGFGEQYLQTLQSSSGAETATTCHRPLPLGLPAAHKPLAAQPTQAPPAHHHGSGLGAILHRYSKIYPALCRWLSPGETCVVAAGANIHN